jgi:dipeptidyl aminopeptidase/acylaminoacyl peptidase
MSRSQQCLHRTIRYLMLTIDMYIYNKISKIIAITLCLLFFSFNLYAEDIKVERARLAGPFTIQSPVMIDSVTLNNKKYGSDVMLDTPVSHDFLKDKPVTDIALNGNPVSGSLNLIEFTIDINKYCNVEIKVEGPKYNKVYISDKEESKSVLSPGQYEVLIKYVADTAAVNITVHTDKEGAIKLGDTANKRPFNLDDNMEMKRYGGISLSPSGKYLISGYSYFDHSGKTIRESKITEVATGKVLRHNASGIQWMPSTDRYYEVRSSNGKKNLIVTDPITGEEDIIAKNLPTDQITISPTEDFLIYNIYTEGPKKQDGVFAVVHPDDRQPYYRNRNNIGFYDIKTGMSRPLTYGYHSAYLQDISYDGRYILFSVSQDSITKRPSELRSFYRLDLATMKADKLIDNDGFCNQVYFLPRKSDKVIVVGTPEAFNGIGKNLPEGMTPSMYDYQLYCLDIPIRKITALTKNFNPSVQRVTISNFDNNIYITAENKDSICLYRLNPQTNEIRLINQPMEVITGLTVAEKAPLMMISGTSECIPDCIYSIRLDKKNNVSLVDDLNKERREEWQLGECKSYSCKSSRGYDITGFYLLPANFDTTRKYPVIVSYYGGCSPTSRRFGGGSHYPYHYWNALGYIVFVVNPSGASGFGQEWAARHVNTAGEGVAEDIIEATEWFADNHSWVNKDKIGCVSASYGGFMTQTLLSKTDLFACGISHAGISSHTSYWGEGYWGYSYSEVSMANSYPWNRKDLYVDRSPIYNADKIHKPILFTHGTADTNVPIGESIQMYTAMKILGVPTAFVMVEGENHGIMDYGKRKKWINTMMAWFQRWLQDDDTWWNGMYPEIKQ